MTGRTLGEEERERKRRVENKVHSKIKEYGLGAARSPQLKVVND